MKVLFYINVLSGGGAERVIANLSNQFSNDNFEVVLVTTYVTRNEYEVVNTVKRINIEDSINLNSNRILKNYKIMRSLRHILTDEKPDVAVSFMEEPNFRLILASIGLKIKTVVSVRNDPSKEYSGMIGKIISHVILPLANGCVFQTKDAKEYFPKSLQNKSRIIFNAVKEEFYQVVRKPVYNKIVAVGRCSKQKNHKLLIDAFEKINSKYPVATLDIYGEGPLRQELIDLTYEKKLEKKIKLKGNVKDVSRVLAKADVFVLSSNYEGMPNALMEAMAAGVPVISTDCPCGGPRMLIDNWKNGVLISVKGINELVDALNRIFLDDELKKKIGIEGKKSASQFKPEKIYDEWKEYLCKVALKG